MTCTCIIWHPQTKEERDFQRANFERARNNGEMHIATMYLASLAGPCQSQKEDK